MKKNLNFMMILLLSLLLLLSFLTVGCGKDSGKDSDKISAGEQKENEWDKKNPNAGKKAPYLVETLFETSENIVAAADVTHYGADPTGKKDSSDAFQDALREVGNAGGGTVWVPAGEYIISKNLTIPALVTLRGDWNDPDGENFNGDYGSIILAKPQSSDSEVSGLFRMLSSSGAMGLTIYYPDQDIKDVKPYSPTFYMAGAENLRTIQNVTLINAYTGLCVDAINECTNLKNVKGLCLNKGLEGYSSGDVGVFDDVTFSPRYWANASGKIKKADRDEIVKFLRDNKSSGMVLHDMEGQQLNDITVEGYEYGIFYSSQPTRFMACNMLYQINTIDCNYGIYAQDGTYKSPTKYAFNQCPILTALDWRCGLLVSNSNIQGNLYSIYNGCPVVSDPYGAPWQAYIHLADVTLSGDTYGNVSHTPSGATVELNDMRENRATKSTGTAFEAVKSGASDKDIQAALDKVGKEGGGVVYLAAGNYDIATGLKVPANTEIIGAAGAPQRHPDNGTVLWCKQPGTATEQRDADALVTLAGDNAGISGVYFMYDSNIIAINEKRDISYFPFAIRGKGTGVYAVNCCISGASHGIDFNNCDDHVVDSLFSSCMYSHIEVSGNNGMVRNSLANATIMYVNNGVISTNVHAMQEDYFEKWGKPNSVYITVGEGSGEQLYNVFMYGGKYLVYVDGGTNVDGANLGSDNLGSYVIEMDSGSATFANSTVSTTNAFHNSGGKLAVYNPLFTFNPNYPDYLNDLN